MEKERRGTEEVGEGCGWVGELETLHGKKIGAYSMLCKKPGSAWVSLARFGLVRSSSVQSTWLLPRGSRCVADGRMVCCEVPAAFFPPVLVKFQQQHDCIIPSTHMTEQGSVFPEVSREFLFVPFFYLSFFFIKEQRLILGRPGWKRKPRPPRTEN